ncbi:MAG: ArsR/SmtB family transcription factor [Promethearchaeota archaeon]
MLCSCEGTCDSSVYFKTLQNFGSELKGNDQYKSLELFLSSIASKKRLIIIKSLIGKERCVCELEAILDKSQSTISHHLRKLERANLITSYKKGNYTYYHLNVEVLRSNMRLLTSILS